MHLKRTNFRYVLALIHKATDDKDLQNVDSKKRNLLHFFGKYGLEAGQEFWSKNI